MPAPRLLFALVATVIAMFAITATASAAVGDLTPAGCVANVGQGNCADPANDALGGATSVAVSPDGTSVYVAAKYGKSGGNSLNHFSRAPDGTLSQIGCFANGGNAGCTDLTNDTLSSARDVVVSSDGKSVYVISDGAVTTFGRAVDGTLTEGSCVANSNPGCASFNAMRMLWSAESIAVSSDGGSVYAVFNEMDEGLIVGFDRAADGALTEDFCWSNHGGIVRGCNTTVGGLSRIDAMHEASGVAVSPDGKSVYVSSRDRSGDDLGSVIVFDRATDGSITSISSCTADDGDRGCTDPASDALGGASDIVVSPDGTSVYVTATLDNSINHFSRAADGTLTQVDCFANTGVHGCTDPAIQSVKAASSVAISPDGKSVYVGSDNVITTFSRADDGTLAQVGCVTDAGLDELASASNRISGCAATANGEMVEVNGLAVSPDGSSLYGTTLSGNGVFNFKRETPPPPAPPAASVPPDTILVSGPKAKHRGSSASFKIAAVGTAYKFECRLRRKAYAPCNSRMTANNLRAGRKYTFRARAISPDGLVDPTPLSYSFRVVD